MFERKHFCIATSRVVHYARTMQSGIFSLTAAPSPGVSSTPQNPLLAMLSSPMLIRRLAFPAAAALATALLPAPLHAEFKLVEDFEDVAVGTALGGANGGENFSRTGAAGTTSVESNPLPSGSIAGYIGNASERVMNVSNGTGIGVYTSLYNDGSNLILPDNATGTLFYQVYRDIGDLVNASIGMTPVAAPVDGGGTNQGFNAFRPQLGINQNSQAWRPRDGGSFDTTPTSFGEAMWINVWQVINNATDAVEFYVQSPSDLVPLQLSVAGQTSFAFRSANAAALETLLIRTGNSNTSAVPPEIAHSQFYVDNIYFDDSGANLVNPVPEPTSAILLGMSGALLGLRRRRKG